VCKRLSLQYDILFDVLSAREHMRIYAALKGVSTPEQGVPSARARRCGLARGCTREYRLTHAQVRLESVKAEVDAKIALLDLAAFADKEVRSALALIVLIGMRPKGRRWCSMVAAPATADPIFHLNPRRD
jgi:hypothetical protein